MISALFTVPEKFNDFFHNHFSQQKHLQGSQGVAVDLADTIAGFQGLVNGTYDDIPEICFYMVGTIDDVLRKHRETAQ